MQNIGQAIEFVPSTVEEITKQNLIKALYLKLPIYNSTVLSALERHSLTKMGELLSHTLRIHSDGKVWLHEDTGQINPQETQHNSPFTSITIEVLTETGDSFPIGALANQFKSVEGVTRVSKDKYDEFLRFCEF